MRQAFASAVRPPGARHSAVGGHGGRLPEHNDNCCRIHQPASCVTPCRVRKRERSNVARIVCTCCIMLRTLGRLGRCQHLLVLRRRARLRRTLQPLGLHDRLAERRWPAPLSHLPEYSHTGNNSQSRARLPASGAAALLPSHRRTCPRRLAGGGSRSPPACAGAAGVPAPPAKAAG